MRAASICLMALAASIVFSAVAVAAEPCAPPSPGEAAEAVAGEPNHDRLQPIPIIAGHTWAVPALINGLDDESAENRARCCFLLGQIASRDAIDPLKDKLDDPSRDVREFAGMALARMGDFDGLEAARAAYYGNRWWIRYWAVDALARLDRVPQVALRDPDPLVRMIAVDGDQGTWGPAALDVEYTGPSDVSLSDTIFGLCNYLIGETDWWWHAGRYEQIIRGNETIVWLDPTWLEGLTNSAYLYWSLERDVEALATYRRAVAMHPDSWESHFELGFFYFNVKERYMDAAAEFQRSRELGCPPDKARMHAHALEKAGRTQEALEVWRDLVAKTPDDLVARHNLRRMEEGAGPG